MATVKLFTHKMITQHSEDGFFDKQSRRNLYFRTKIYFTENLNKTIYVYSYKCI